MTTVGRRIGVKLKTLLAERGLTQAWLAKRTGISLKSVQRHVGNHPVRRDFLAIYAQALSVSVDALCTSSSLGADVDLLNSYLTWLERDVQHLPYWPTYGPPVRPSLSAIYVEPTLAINGRECLASVIARNRFRVLVGPAGSGKTTFLHAFALRQAQASREFIPVMIPVGALGGFLERNENASLLGFLREWWAHNPILDFAAELPRVLVSGTVGLLFDGLDSLASSRPAVQNGVLAIINNLPRDYPETCMVMVTCRDSAFNRCFGYKMRSEYARVTMQDLSEQRRSQLLDRLQDFTGERNLGDKLQKAVVHFPELQLLMRTPMGFTELVLSLAEGEAPRDVMDAYNSDVSVANTHGVIGVIKEPLG